MDDPFEVWFRTKHRAKINCRGFFVQESLFLTSFVDRLVIRLSCLCILIKNQLINFFKCLPFLMGIEINFLLSPNDLLLFGGLSPRKGLGTYF